MDIASLIGILGAIGMIVFAMVSGGGVGTFIDVPSILIELGYITNKEEKNLLNNSEYKRKLCAVMKRAILKYFDLHFSKIKTPYY